jgi:glutamate formiminotransferase
VVGAREVLVAFNVNLSTDNFEIAKAIARLVRASSGGLPGVKAMGVLLQARCATGQAGQAQVSMNLTDWKKTSVAKAFEAVNREALARSVTVQSSEIVGLVPAEALGGVLPSELKLAGFGPEKILENRLAQVYGTATGG